MQNSVGRVYLPPFFTKFDMAWSMESEISKYTC